eukprot:643146-Pleurochrysis_carterae.AAC.1
MCEPSVCAHAQRSRVRAGWVCTRGMGMYAVGGMGMYAQMAEKPQRKLKSRRMCEEECGDEV